MFKKTHESITKKLTKMLNDLEELRESLSQKALFKQSQISQLNMEINDLHSEITRCRKTEATLKEIVG